MVMAEARNLWPWPALDRYYYGLHIDWRLADIMAIITILRLLFISPSSSS